jgi:hypothetical protein
MATKKKSRPLFEVPAEVEAGAHSGWVYRSGVDEEPVRRAQSSSRQADTSVPPESAVTVAWALATHVLMLGMAIVALPWTIGVRTLESLAKQSD